MKEYYIQYGYVGNSVLWWAINGNGYTTEIEKAGKFNENFIKTIRQHEIAWPCDYIDNSDSKRVVVDGQFLDHKFKITKL